MTKLGHSKTIRFLIFFALILAATSCSQKQQQQPAAEQTTKTQPLTIEQVAKTYGLDSFGQVEAIRYTWNAQFPGVNISHPWIWEPKKDQVTYDGKDKDGKPVKVTYLRSQLSSLRLQSRLGLARPCLIGLNLGQLLLVLALLRDCSGILGGLRGFPRHLDYLLGPLLMVHHLPRLVG